MRATRSIIADHSKDAFWVKLSLVEFHGDKANYLVSRDVDRWRDTFERDPTQIVKYLPIVEAEGGRFRGFTVSPRAKTATIEFFPVVEISQKGFEYAKKPGGPNGHHRPCLEVERDRLVCLDGQCRIKAALSRSESEQWGLVNIVNSK